MSVGVQEPTAGGLFVAFRSRDYALFWTAAIVSNSGTWMQTITIPFSVWLMKSFIDEVPAELEEAARVDGAKWHTVILRITLPLVRPGLIVTSMFAFVFSWNNAAFPLVLSSQRTATLPIGTLTYFATAGATWTFIGAAAVAAMLPPMFIFLALDRYVVRGLTFGSVKG